MELIKKYKQGKLTTSDVRSLNNLVIFLMVLIAVSSILWTISIYLLSNGFHNGIIGAKLEFRARDFTQLDDMQKTVFDSDLEQLLNGPYLNRTTSDIATERHTMPENELEDSQTKKPNVPKIKHLFRFSSTDNEIEENEKSENIETTTHKVSKKIFDLEFDRNFLSTMSIDVHQTRWLGNTAVEIIYSFPFLSEIISIIWTAMCLIFQSGVKKHWSLPKPWRIVVPSIIMFAFMTIGSITYTILGNKYLKAFCADLRAPLTDPSALSCGQAMSVLRPLIIPHRVGHDVYLNLFRSCYIITMLLWLLATLIMTLRFVFAIDFQLVDIKPSYDNMITEGGTKRKDHEFTEVLLNSPVEPTRYLQVDEGPHKSDDDFQSVKSHLSEVAAPLLVESTVRS